MADYRIRDAVIDDCEGIFTNIQELAVHHHSPNGVKLTVDTLKRDGFGENPLFRCQVAENINSGEIIGHTLFFPFYSSWIGKGMFMEDLFVIERERNKRVGVALLKRLVQLCVEEGFNRLQWEVMEFNKRGMNFYNKQGAEDTTADGGRRVFRFSKEQMEEYIQ
ncbi:hypothetical protein SNE40_000095 [Patella caerulea]|uniref:N-acetyltransferase domain-containing protein n=1 Tax=Patella caerulea TaxID=87958 RepID=A0AAN8KBK7_PATCE